MSLLDQPVRDRIRSSLDETLVVEAAAGTGKTTALVARIVEVIRSGRGELASIVAVTFTEKAAGELKLRLRSEIEKVRRDAGDDLELLRRLDKSLGELEQAHVGTIHGFCADLLKERPLEACVDPLFEIASEDECLRLYRRTFDRWLQEKLADPPPGIRRLLRQPADPEQQGPVDRLFAAGRELLERRDFPAPWEIRPFDRDREIDALVARIVSIAARSEKCTNPHENLYQDLAVFRTLKEEIEGWDAARVRRDYDLLEHRLPALKPEKNRKGRGFFAEGVERDQLVLDRDVLLEDVKRFRERASADLAAHLQHELPEIIARYEAVKAKAGRLDFLDLLLRARDLIRDRAALRRELQERFTHVFIDEFQDTDPLQAEILLLLAADDASTNDWRSARPRPGKLFIVADPKQSIYRFRRADVALYEEIKARLQSQGAAVLHLTVSFRASPDLQEVVNQSMSDVMVASAESHQAAYVPLSPHRSAIPGQPGVVALPIPRPYGEWGRVTVQAIQSSEPGAVAEWVRWLLKESGFKVTSREHDAPQPVTPADVCLLFRRFVDRGGDVTRPYVEALQARDVPHVLVGGKGFHEREETAALRTALTAIERPDDELSIFSTLRGPLFGFETEDLFLFRGRHGPLHPFRKLEVTGEEADGRVAAALQILAGLHKNRNFHPIALTLRQLLDRTRAQAGFALWQAGDQILVNVLRLLQMARDFEGSGGLSFRGFVEQLEDLAERGETGQPIVEEDVEGVRLMTVHKAKGLEFPVVVLCDITCRKGDFASRHVDSERKLFAVRLAGGAPWELLDRADTERKREAAESERLLYVAATRARDLLVVPAVADEPRDFSWVSTLHPALYPAGKAHRFPVVVPGLRFGDDTVLDRPAGARVLPGDGIKPGEHKPRRGSHRVVWWDAALLEKPTGERPSVRRHEILQEVEAGAGRGGPPLHEQWRAQREALLARGGSPQMRIVSATARAAVATAPTAPITVEILPRVPRRPVGKAFGTLVHEILSRADFDADRPAIARLASTLGRMLGNTKEEEHAATEAAARALSHPLLRRAAAASQKGLCHREAPFVYRHADGEIIEGILDLAFRDGLDGPWTVVDFKTDVRPDIGQDEYRRQVALYSEALRRASGVEAKGVLLYV